MRAIRRKKYTYLAAGLVVVIIAGSMWGLIGKTSSAAPEPGYVHTVAAAPVEETLIASGLIRPAMTVEVRAEASGVVRAVLVSEGDHVRLGQELVRLDSTMAAAAVDEAEARLRQAYLQDAATQTDLDEQSVALERNAYDRARALYAKGLVARSDLEQKQLSLRLAERALQRTRSARQGSRAHIEQALADVRRSRAQFEQTIVRAPFDATVLRRSVDVGSGVSAVGQSASGGTVLMTLGDARRSAFYASVTAADAQRLRAGMPARIRLDAVAGGVLSGVVHSVSTAGDLNGTTQLATFPVIVALTAAPNNWVNVPARADVVLRVEPDSTVVPPGCVHTDAAGISYALLETEGGPERRDVDLGAIQPDRLQVRSGLVPGQVIRCR
jgi:macrolide-specific efflux system membrane fusion protein